MVREGVWGIAQGSLKELETHSMLSKRVNLNPSEAIDPILYQCESVSRLLSLSRLFANLLLCVAYSKSPLS